MSADERVLVRGFFARGGAWVIGQSVLMIAVVAAGPLTPGGWAGGWFRWAAMGLFSLGAALGISGVWVLRGNRTIFPHPRPGSALVTHGVYRWVRHPLYSSVMSLSAGWGLWWGSWPTLFAGAALTLLLRLKAQREEAWLQQHFPEYTAYAAKVCRFIPGLW